MAVTDEAILKIKEMITSGQLRPGDRLPPEKDLGDSLGLSRSSLREAVKALEMIKVLDVRRGDGTYVTSLEPRLLLEAMTFVVDLHADQSVLEVFATRRILEVAAVGLAAGRIDAGLITDLYARVDAVGASEDVEELLQHDLDFHRSITEAAGNGYLAGLVEGTAVSTLRARIWRGVTEENATGRTLAEHRAIVRALETRDAPLAQALMGAHISGVEQWLRSAL